MDEDELKLMHESIHSEHRKEISELHWQLVQSHAREKVKDRQIALLQEQLAAVTTP